MFQEHLLFTIYMPVHFTLSYPGLAKKLVLPENGTEVCIKGGWITDIMLQSIKEGDYCHSVVKLVLRQLCRKESW